MERVNAEVFKCLNDNNVFLEGCLLKPNMVLPGSTHPDRSKITP
jgi:fructose-bisphosphate aldolase class I